MKRYEKYKPSGIEWISEVPEHWEVMQLRRIAKVFTGSTPPTNRADYYDSEDILWYTPSDFTYDTYKLGESERKMSYKAAKEFVGELFPKNTILMTGIGLVGKIGIAPEDCYSNQQINAIVVNRNHSFEYVAYYLKGIKDIILSLPKASLLPILNQSETKQIAIVVPPIAEQKAIVAYLDARCGDIDKVVATQEKRIALLNEMKQSIITQAVTQGLNPDAKMKDSGVEWIGMVPEHWEIKKLKYHFYNYKAGPFGSSLITSKLLSEGDILVYTPEHIANQSADLVNNLYLPNEREDEMSQFIVTKGDIIFPIVGTLGRAMVINEDMPKGIINQRLAKFKIKDTLDVDFFMVLFADCDIYKQHIEANCRGSIIVNLTKELVGDIPIITPPKEEQIAIRRHLAFQCGKIDKQIKAVTRQIELLREYKQSLITEVVTGKRKVC